LSAGYGDLLIKRLIEERVTVVEVLASVFGLAVFTQNSLEQQERVVIFVSPAGGFEEGTNVEVGHFIISDEHQRGSEIRLISVSDDQIAGSSRGETTEVLFSQFSELLVGDITSTDDNDVRSDVVGSVIVDDLVLSDGTDVFSDTENGLTHHVVSV